MSLAGKYIYLAMRNGQDYASVLVKAEDEWSITIWFQNRDTIIPRSDIKSIQVK